MRLIRSVLMILCLVFIQCNYVKANIVGVEVSHVNFGNIDGNMIISGTMVEWRPAWLLNIMNHPDGGDALISPKIIMESTLSFDSLWPDDPEILSVNQERNIYVWDFGAVALKVDEPAHLNVSANETIFSAPVIFSATRKVVPEYLTDASTIQTLTVTFSLDSPLPEDVNQVGIGLGGAVQAYDLESPVQWEVISQNDVDGWSKDTDDGSASWYPTDIQNIIIGKTYTFIAEIKIQKSSEIIGNPKYIPGVGIQYSNNTGLQQEDGNTITIDHPDGVSATYEVANNDIIWQPFTSISRYDFHFNSVIEASENFCTINGRVFDAVTGSMIPGSSLFFTSPEFYKEYQITGDGSFNITDIPTGTYQVEISADGYQSETYEGLTLELGVHKIWWFPLNRTGRKSQTHGQTELRSPTIRGYQQFSMPILPIPMELMIFSPWN